MKTLKLNEETALRLYPTATLEFKELLEENFGKEFFNQKITDRIKDYDDILEMSGVDESADDVKVKGFDNAENKVVSAFIKKMRISKVYRQGWFPKIGENRYYYWLQQASSGSGFVFFFTNYVNSAACTSSASRLCFPNAETAKDAALKFNDIDNDLIDL